MRPSRSISPLSSGSRRPPRPRRSPLDLARLRTGDKGLGPDGTPRSNHEPGYDLTATVTVFAEGPYGTLAEDLMHAKGMKAEAKQPQVYSLGVKEIIKNDPAKLGIDPDKGFAVHTLGWPMPKGAFGGGWLYHLGGGTFSVGYVLGLDWENPALDLHAVFNEYKKHPLLQKYLRGGEVKMAANYGLEPWEVEQGFILACQSRPVSDTITLDYDKT